MSIEIRREQFLHHQLGLRYTERNPGTPIGGSYKPTGTGWTNAEHATLIMAMRGGKSWTPTLVDELMHYGCLPVVYNGTVDGRYTQGYCIGLIVSKHDADPQVLWTAEHNGTDYTIKTRESETIDRDELLLEQLRDEAEDKSAEHDISGVIWHMDPIVLSNRYDHWMASYRPIPHYRFDDTNRPVDMQIDISGGELPLGIDEQHVWTRVWADGCECIIPGYHRINRLAYIVTKYPWDADKDQNMEIID